MLPLFKISQFLTDACIDSQFEVVFDVLEVELNKSATLETVFNGGFYHFFLKPPFAVIRQPDLKGCSFKEDKLNCLIVNFRSVTGKPRRDKQGTYFNRKKMNRSIFFLVPNLHVFLVWTSAYYNMQAFCIFGNIISGLAGILLSKMK